LRWYREREGAFAPSLSDAFSAARCPYAYSPFGFPAFIDCSSSLALTVRSTPLPFGAARPNINP